MSAAARPVWRAQGERGSPLAMRVIAWVARRFGLGAARALLPPIVVYFMVFGGAARRASPRYLRRSLGREPATRDIYRHYHAFAVTLLDRVCWLGGRLDDYDIDLVGAADVRAALRDGGCLLVGAHLGSFELLRVLARATPDVRVHVLMHQANARKTATVLRTIDARVDEHVIALGEPGTMLAVREAVAAGRAVGLLADRSIGGGDEVPATLLGGPIALPRGPWRLAAALDVPVLLFHAVWQGGRRYRVEFVPMPLARDAHGRIDVEAAIAHYATWLDDTCRRVPYHWFNFYDFWGDDHARVA